MGSELKDHEELGVGQIVICLLHGVPTPLIGIIEDLDYISRMLVVTYAANIITEDDNTHRLVSAPLAATLVGPTFGADAELVVPIDNISVMNIIEPAARTGEHPVLDLFFHFWGLELPDPA